MNPAKLKKVLVLIPTFALAILLVQQNYNWIFGLMIGTAMAFSSCELIQKAVSNSFVRKANRRAAFFLVGFLFRFVFFVALLYVAIIHFRISAIAVALSFTLMQLLYPFYLIHTLEKRQQNV